MLFPDALILIMSNVCLGKINSELTVSEAYWWLERHSEQMDVVALAERLREWRNMRPAQLTELLVLLHAYGSDTVLEEVAMDADMYAAPGPQFGSGVSCSSQAEVALMGLEMRQLERGRSSPGVDATLLQILRTLVDVDEINSHTDFHYCVFSFLAQYRQADLSKDAATWSEFSSLARRLAQRFAGTKGRNPRIANTINALNAWADSLDRAIAAKAKPQTKPKAKSPARTVAKRAKEQGSHGGTQA